MRERPIVFLGCLALALAAAAASAQNVPGTALAPPDSSALPRGGNKADTYGTSHTSYQRISSTEFTPGDSSMTYSDTGYLALTFGRYPTNASGGGTFLATPHLPSGALVTAVEFDACDTNGASDASFQVQSTTFLGENSEVIGAASTSGAGGCDFTVADVIPDYSIDNNFNQLVLVAYIPVQDGTISLAGAIIRYVLQVSPAPMVATFNDVAPGDFGFQYIEALAASGITGGCGGGNFCPNATLTRAQMAVFLAKGLGLQFQ
jgi:hypothetical protein